VSKVVRLCRIPPTPGHRINRQSCLRLPTARSHPLDSTLASTNPEALVEGAAGVVTTLTVWRPAGVASEERKTAAAPRFGKSHRRLPET